MAPTTSLPAEAEDEDEEASIADDEIPDRETLESPIPRLAEPELGGGLRMEEE